MIDFDREAVEYLAGAPRPPVALTVEHASARLPSAWSWPEEDARLVGDHWSFDLGIADFARQLSAALGAPAVLSRFSRLLVDPNRPLGHETMFRAQADGAPVHLNAALDDAERSRRIDGWYRPYHQAVDAMLTASPGADVLGLHSYTPRYEGAVREVEVGVLHDAEPALGAAWLAALSGHGYDVRSNEPWSGVDGLMFSPQSHATRHGRRAVELEIRYDLLLDAKHRERLVALVAHTARTLHG